MIEIMSKRRSTGVKKYRKRNSNLNKKAIETAKEIQKMDSRSARWVASDAIRELTSEAVQKRLQER
jgi:ribonuclease HI